MKAIVLCGGLGTRLGALTRDTPKPLLPVAGRPFIAHVLDQLLGDGLEEIVLAVSFQWEKMRAVVGDVWGGVPVRYSVEAQALGTGGAIRQAMQQAGVQEALVLNGDTLLKLAPLALWRFARAQRASIAIALKQLDDTARFGRVSIDPDGRVLAFREKNALGGPGLINSGMYYVHADALAAQPPGPFSLEKQVLEAPPAGIAIYGLPTQAYFIDMGVPDDLARARAELPTGA